MTVSIMYNSSLYVVYVLCHNINVNKELLCYSTSCTIADTVTVVRIDNIIALNTLASC